MKKGNGSAAVTAESCKISTFEKN